MVQQIGLSHGGPEAERENAWAQGFLVFPLLFHLGHQYMEWCYPHSGWVSPLVNSFWEYPHRARNVLSNLLGIPQPNQVDKQD
jgi:hypothetical protein